MKRTVYIYRDQADGEPRVKFGSIGHDEFSVAFDSSLTERFGQQARERHAYQPYCEDSEMQFLLRTCRVSYDYWGSRERGERPSHVVRCTEEQMQAAIAEFGQSQYSEVCDLRIS